MPELYGRVYFIGPNSGPIKIGFTSQQDVSLRLRQLQTGAADRYEVIASFDAYFEIEKSLHSLLSIHRTRADGEWFEREAALSILNCWKHSYVSDSRCSSMNQSRFADAMVTALDSMEVPDNDSFELSVCRLLISDLFEQVRDTHPDEPLPLYAWLLSQQSRDDPVGDLASDIKSNDSFPKVAELQKYLAFAVDRSMPSAVVRTIFQSWIECYYGIQRLRFRPDEVMYWPRR